MDLQRTVSQDFSKNVQQANTEINKHLDDLKDQLDKGKISQTDYDEQVSNWQKGQVLLNAIASGLAAPTQSGAGIAAATASPALSYAIGQEFKKIAEENKRKSITEEAELTKGQETAHVLAHAVLGAAVSAAGGNDVLAEALSAGGAEAAAPVISGWLYGEKDGSKLTAEQKETVVAITGLLGTTVGAVTGNTAADTVQGSLNANSAVGNNYTLKDAEQDIERIGGSLVGTGAAIGDLATPLLNPRETWEAFKLLANSPDRVELLKLGFVLLVNERQQEYDLFVKQNDVFGQSMVIGRSTGDIGLAIGGAAQLVAKSPSALKYFSAALAQLKATGSTTINGIKVVYVAGKISRAADNYVLPIQSIKPTYEAIRYVQNLQRPLGIPLNDWAKMSAMLRDVATNKGNFSIGTATAEQADAMGKAWVGTGYTVASDGRTLVSADKLRTYRPPTVKRSCYAHTGVQANFERLTPVIHRQGNKSSVRNTVISNGHLNIKD